MARTGIGRVHLVWFPPWSKRPMGFKRGAPWTDNVKALSAPQLKACVALAEAAYAAYGTRGKINGIPAVAIKVQAAVPAGPGVHGGVSPAERARISHDATAKRISALRALIAMKERVVAR